MGVALGFAVIVCCGFATVSGPGEAPIKAALACHWRIVMDGFRVFVGIVIGLLAADLREAVTACIITNLV